MYMEAFIAYQSNMLERLLPVSRNKPPSNIYKKYIAILFVVQTNCVALYPTSLQPWVFHKDREVTPSV